MDVVDYTLVGRDWLGFEEAIYYFELTQDHGCKMTRVTTYLRPCLRGFIGSHWKDWESGRSMTLSFGIWKMT